jgi:hypothetical protein
LRFQHFSISAFQHFLLRLLPDPGLKAAHEAIGRWLKQPRCLSHFSFQLFSISAFGFDVIEGGETDRIWRMIYELQSGRARVKSRRDDKMVAQGKRSAALGSEPKLISLFLLPVWRTSEARQTGSKKRQWGDPQPRAAASAALPWATILLPLRGARQANLLWKRRGWRFGGMDALDGRRWSSHAPTHARVAAILSADSGLSPALLESR